MSRRFLKKDLRGGTEFRNFLQKFALDSNATKLNYSFFSEKEEVQKKDNWVTSPNRREKAEKPEIDLRSGNLFSPKKEAQEATIENLFSPNPKERELQDPDGISVLPFSPDDFLNLETPQEYQNRHGGPSPSSLWRINSRSLTLSPFSSSAEKFKCYSFSPSCLSPKLI